VKGSQQVQWEYATHNAGVEDTENTSLMTMTHGDVRNIMPTNDIILEPGQAFRIPVPKSVSLIETGEDSGTVLATGELPDGDCSSTATSSFEAV
jgi:rRNA pseudouridine-1189 N-methylase Emg1 (Nep1/Mra1 family)